jgi:MerR family transcriptional regulator, light-induced transcriptional regulator
MPSDAELLPIRELSRLSGVNSVTLRAWERRYGLLKPQRTAKGHRLYSYADVERVQQVVHWLNRGISVGQVQQYLGQENLPSFNSQWQPQLIQFQSWLTQLNLPAVDNACQELFALYPDNVLAEHFFRPLLTHLQPRQSESVLLQQLLISKLQLRLLNNPVNKPSARLLIVNIDPLACPVYALLLALLIQQQGYACTTLALPCRIQDLPHLLQQSQANAMLLLCDSPLHADVLSDSAVPFFIYGHTPVLSPHLQPHALDADFNLAVQSLCTTLAGQSV